LGETINGRIVVDGSISPGGIVLSPVKLSLEKGGGNYTTRGWF